MDWNWMLIRFYTAMMAWMAFTFISHQDQLSQNLETQIAKYDSLNTIMMESDSLMTRDSTIILD